KDLERATFQASGTYTALDNNQPGVTRTTFTTASSGSATGPAGSSSSTGSGGTKGDTQQSLVGSAAAPNFRGSLDAIVYASGKLSLTRNGKKVTSLKSGSWTFSVDDESKKAGFAVQVLNGKAQTITSVAFVGSHDVTV